MKVLLCHGLLSLLCSNCWGSMVPGSSSSVAHSSLLDLITFLLIKEKVKIQHPFCRGILSFWKHSAVRVGDCSHDFTVAETLKFLA